MTASLALGPASFPRPSARNGPTAAVAGISPVYLDTYHQTSTGDRVTGNQIGLVDCPNNDLILVNTTTGHTVRGRCRRLACYSCISWCGYRVARAIGLANPTQAVLLTRVGDTWKSVHRRVNRFIEYLRGDGLAVELAYHVEPDPSEDGHHVHAWVHGEVLDNETVAAAAVRVGFGEFAGVMGWDVSTGDGPPIVKYGLKAVLNRPAGATELWPEARHFLTMNGDRLVHQTNGFYRAGEEGEQFGIKTAISRAFHGNNPPTYKVIRNAQSDAFDLRAPI